VFTNQLQHLVKQISHILAQLTDEEYSRPLPVYNGSSIGQHARHVIEFFDELEGGYHRGFVDYNNRKRNKLLETHKASALAAFKNTVLACTKPDKSLQLSVDDHSLAAPSVTVATTYYRELVFVIEHTVHHMALVRIGVEHLQTVVVPAGFGIAASTQRHQSKCAQ
jgi:uncharacterized damage-inducible protein DinB